MKFDCRKKNFNIVKKMAVKFTRAIGENTRLFYVIYNKQKNLRYYDFEPEILNQHLETTLEIIKS